MVSQQKNEGHPVDSGSSIQALLKSVDWDKKAVSSFLAAHRCVSQVAIEGSPHPATPYGLSVSLAGLSYPMERKDGDQI